MRTAKIRGKNAEERIESISGLIGDLQRKMAMKKLEVMPSIVPLSCSADDAKEGTVLMKYLFPITGKINKVFSVMKNARKVGIRIDVSTANYASAHNVVVGDSWRNTEVAYEVKEGSLITVTIDSIEGAGETPVEVYLSLLFLADVSRSVVQKIEETRALEFEAGVE